MIDINSIRRNNLKRLLEKCDIGKIELARRAGKSPQYINAILNDEKGFSDKVVEKLSVALCVEENEFYRGIFKEGQPNIVITQAKSQETTQDNSPATETPSDNIPDDSTLLGIAKYVTNNGTVAEYEKFRLFGEAIKTEIEAKKKQLSQQPQMDKVLPRAA